MKQRQFEVADWLRTVSKAWSPFIGRFWPASRTAGLDAYVRRHPVKGVHWSCGTVIEPDRRTGSAVQPPTHSLPHNTDSPQTQPFTPTSTAPYDHAESETHHTRIVCLIRSCAHCAVVPAWPKPLGRNDPLPLRFGIPSFVFVTLLPMPECSRAAEDPSHTRSKYHSACPRLRSSPSETSPSRDNPRPPRIQPSR